MLFIVLPSQSPPRWAGGAATPQSGAPQNKARGLGGGNPPRENK